MTEKQTDILEQVQGVLREHCRVTTDTTLESRLAEDLGLDSMGLLALALHVENHYQLVLGEDPSDPPTTVGDIVTLVEARLAERKESP